MTKIAVIGAGTGGSSIIKSLSKTENEIIVGLRDPSMFGGATTIENALKAGEIIVLALPYEAGYKVALDHQDDLKGKIVVDMMNPLEEDLSGYHTFDGKSGAEHLQEALPDSQVVETFNHVDGPVLADPQGALQFVIGRDSSATNQIAELAKDAGFDAQSIVDLTKTRELEAFGFLWIYFTVFEKKNMDLKLLLTDKN